MIRQIFITLLATSHFYMVKFKLIKRLKLRKKCTSRKEIGVGLTKSATLLTNLIVVSLATRHSSAARYISLKYCKYCNYLVKLKEDFNFTRGIIRNSNIFTRSTISNIFGVRFHI